MCFRLAFAVAAVIAVGFPAAATAQASASAVVRATIRPGNCTTHSRCGDNPGKGPKPKPKTKQTGEPTASIVTVQTTILATGLDTAAAVQPLRISITAADGSLALSLLPPARPLRAVGSTPITVTVEY